MPNKDEIKGRAKQATGVLTGDKDLEREGKIDRATGVVKEKIGAVKEKVDVVRDRIADKVHTEPK